jgi:hypothetical protein
MPTNASAFSMGDQGQETETIRLGSISLVTRTTIIVSKIHMQCCLAGCTKAKATLKSVSNTARRGGIEAGGDVHTLKFLV